MKPFLPSYELVEPVEPADRPATRTAFLLHGIFGSGRNWRSFARAAVERRPDTRIVLVDLRQHGESTNAPPLNTLLACARDLAQVARAVKQRPEIVYGHSFGGKVALVYAREVANDLRELWLLDSPPGLPDGSLQPAETEVGRVLSIMRAAKLPVAHRGELLHQFAAHGLSRRVSTWLATNLKLQSPGGYVWRFDLDALEELLLDYWKTDGFLLLADPPPGLKVHVVQAARSDRWKEPELRRIAALQTAGKLQHHVLVDAGHWLHVDNPKDLLPLLTGVKD